MKDGDTDRIAREAARMVHVGAATRIDDAIRMAVEGLGLHETPRPGPGRVRAHARAMSMQALGVEGYRDLVREVWRIGEELMSLLEHALPETQTLLAGRAAAGQIDGGVVLHVRAHTPSSIGSIAGTLVEHGYEEPTFETAETRFGRLDRMRLDESGYEIVITRCPPGLPPDARSDHDLFTGRKLVTATSDALRAHLGKDRGNDSDSS